MDPITIADAAARTGWSARMLRYLESVGLVAPKRTASGYRLYGLRELNQLRSLRDLRERFAIELDELAFAARLRRDPDLRAAVDTWLARRRPLGRLGRLGAAKARAASRRLTLTKGIDGNDTTLRRERPGARLRGQAPDRVGRPADAGARRDPRAVRGGAAARRLPRLGLPARDDGDGEPDAHAQGRRRRRRPVRLESALDPGRRRGGARRRVRRLGLRDQGRGQRHLLRAHRGGRRPQAAHHDGRRRRRDRRAPQRPPRAARRRHRRHRGDDDRRDPAQGARARRQARLPGRRRQRGAHEAPLRQPLRHRPVDDRRDHPRDERPARRQALRRRRLRLGRPRRRHAREGARRARDRHRGRSDAGARGGDGRLRGAVDGAGGRDRRHLLHGHRQQVGARLASTSSR